MWSNFLLIIRLNCIKNKIPPRAWAFFPLVEIKVASFWYPRLTIRSFSGSFSKTEERLNGNEDKTSVLKMKINLSHKLKPKTKQISFFFCNNMYKFLSQWSRHLLKTIKYNKYTNKKTWTLDSIISKTISSVKVQKLKTNLWEKCPRNQ